MRIYALLKDMIAAIKRMSADYVVEDKIIQDTATVTERCRKWNSGFCEYWFSKDWGIVKSGQYYCNFYWIIGRIELPPGLFKIVDGAFVNGKWGTGYSLMTAREYDVSVVSSTMASNQNEGPLSATYHVIGRWK